MDTEHDSEFPEKENVIIKLNSQGKEWGPLQGGRLPLLPFSLWDSSRDDEGIVSGIITVQQLSGGRSESWGGRGDAAM